MNANEKRYEEHRIVNLRELKKHHPMYELKIRRDVINECYIKKKTHKAFADEYSILIPSENNEKLKYHVSKASVDRIVIKYKHDLQNKKALDMKDFTNFKKIFMVDFMETAPMDGEKGIISNYDIMEVYNEDKKKKFSINEINNYLLQCNINPNNPMGTNISNYVFRKASSEKNVSYSKPDFIIDPKEDKKPIFLCKLLHINRNRPYYVITLKEYSAVKSPYFFMMAFSYKSREENDIKERIINMLRQSTYNSEDMVFENRKNKKVGKSVWDFYLLFSEKQIRAQNIREDILNDILREFSDSPIFLGHTDKKNKAASPTEKTKTGTKATKFPDKIMEKEAEGNSQTHKKEVIQRALNINDSLYNIYKKNIFLPEEENDLLEKYCLMKNVPKNQLILCFILNYIENWNSYAKKCNPRSNIHDIAWNRYLTNELFLISELEAKPKRLVTTVSIPGEIYRRLFVEIAGYIKLHKKATPLDFRFSEKSLLAHIIKTELEKLRADGFLDYYDKMVSEGRIITEKIYNDLEETEEPTDKTYIENWKIAFKEKYLFPWDLYEQYYSLNQVNMLPILEEQKESEESEKSEVQEEPKKPGETEKRRKRKCREK